MAALVAPFEAISRGLWGHGISARWFDDLCRLAAGLCLMVGLISLWKPPIASPETRGQPTDPLALARPPKAWAAPLATAACSSPWPAWAASPNGMRLDLRPPPSWSRPCSSGHSPWHLSTPSDRDVDRSVTGGPHTDRWPRGWSGLGLGLILATRLAQPWRLATTGAQEALLSFGLILALFLAAANGERQAYWPTGGPHRWPGKPRSLCRP